MKIYSYRQILSRFRQIWTIPDLDLPGRVGSGRYRRVSGGLYLALPSALFAVSENLLIPADFEQIPADMDYT